MRKKEIYLNNSIFNT